MKKLRLRVLVEVTVPDDFRWQAVEVRDASAKVEWIALTDDKNCSWAGVPENARVVEIRPVHQAVRR